jgi:membrane-bound lytic murein transglycosylase A
MRLGKSLFALALLFTLSACAALDKKPSSEQDIPISLKKAQFADFQSWQNDQQQEALSAFLKSCVTLPNADVTLGDKIITIQSWRNICDIAKTVEVTNQKAAQLFFETYFEPYQVLRGQKTKGLFTGYYEPELRGSLTQGGVFQTALYAKPDDLITVDLGEFKDEWQGKQLKGYVAGDRFKPYPKRAEIVAGALQNRAKPLVYVDSPYDAFFLQVQGSGRVTLDDGTVLRLGYADQNGHAYYAIGKSLIERGILTKETVSMLSIKGWMEQNPSAAASLMNENPSYVFFRILEGEGPIGAEGVPVTAGRSLAVDRKKWVYGLPLWLETTLPDGTAYERLMVAQDTGGAIKGAIRGDVFFGFGAWAEQTASAMKQQGEYWVLLPKANAAISGAE